MDIDFRDNDGNEVENPPKGKWGEYFLNAEVHKIGEALGIEGTYPQNYGTQQIFDAIERLTALCDGYREALKLIVANGDFTAPEGMKRIAKAALQKEGE